MKRLLLFFVPILACILTLLLAEGTYSLVRWNSSNRSILYQAYKKLVRAVPDDAQPELKLASRAEIEILIPDLIKAGAGMGNAPYDALRSEGAAINARNADGCIFSKPLLKKEMTFLRSIDYELFDPPVLFYDEAASVSQPLREFIEKYAVRRVTYNTNSEGERLTVPAIEAHDIVLVAGDSVANGVMIQDKETLSSNLQQHDTARKYVNLGVAGVTAAEIVCNLTSAAKRYHGRIKELVYVYCENDFRPDEPFGQPEDVISWLTDYVKREGITKVKVILAPAIFNVVPQVTRFNGYRGEGHPTHKLEVEHLEKLAAKAGFEFFNIADLALRETQERGTSYAALSLFVDIRHLSPYGTAKLADTILRVH